MQACDLHGLSGGRLLTTTEFRVAPVDLAAHVEASFLGEVVGSSEEYLTTAGPAGQADAGWGRVCPVPVVIGRAVACLGAELGGSPVDVRKVARVRALAPAIVGEPLEALARVRFARRTDVGLCLTLDVAVRRRRGGEILRFELAVEVVEAARTAA